jgi:cytochrome c-type biogenesis protein CcmE
LWIGAGVLLLAAAVGLCSTRSSRTSSLFSPPTAEHRAPQNRAFRIGGMVVEKSLTRGSDGLTVRFKVTDTAQTVPVVYTGILPDLFKEGKGVVAQGRIGADGVFHATEVLAKHDENYMPPEAAAAVNQAQSRAAMDKAAKTLKP